MAQGGAGATLAWHDARKGRRRAGLAEAAHRTEFGEQHRGRRVADPRNRRQEVALWALRMLIDMRADASPHGLHLRLEERDHMVMESCISAGGAAASQLRSCVRIPSSGRAGARRPAARQPRAAAAPTAAAAVSRRTSHSAGIRRVGIGAGQTTARIGLDDRGIDDTDDEPRIGEGLRSPSPLGPVASRHAFNGPTLCRAIQRSSAAQPWRHRQQAPTRTHAAGYRRPHRTSPYGHVNIRDRHTPTIPPCSTTSCAD